MNQYHIPTRSGQLADLYLLDAGRFFGIYTFSIWG